MIMETNELKRERCCRGRFWRCSAWVILGILGFIAIVVISGAVIMWLWNWLIPELFKGPMIGFWQAIGLAIIGRLLFGGFHHRFHGRHRWRHHHGCHCGSNCGCNEGHGNHKHECCSDDKNQKWQHYENYWSEEGEKAFDEYVKRKNESKS
jgi:hypothetical protein